MNARQYNDKVLQLVLEPFIVGYCAMLFQQHKARAHTTHLTHRLDLNPIEHVCDEINRRIHQGHVLPATLQQMTNAVLHAHSTISRGFIQNLLESITHRYTQVIDYNDGY